MRSMRWGMVGGSLLLGIGIPSTVQAQDEFAVEVHGLAEAATAVRLWDDPTQSDDFVLSEVRFRLDLSHFTDRAEFAFKGDFTADGFLDATDIDIRQAVITLHLSDALDLRAGRQVLTWGTGDFVFLNDLFPKDFVSFFVGRDDEFLKAPSNAVKGTWYSGAVTVDVVWTPVFEPDRFITGERLSFFDPSLPGRVSAETMGQPFTAVSPAKEVGNGELAGRLSGTVGGSELALYGYTGFTKSPLAFDQAANMAAHSSLAVYGASARSALGSAIANVEVAYHNSADNSGTDPDVPNSQFRGLAGYERELVSNLTLGLQYYLEWTQDHEQLLASSPAPEFEPDEARHTFTVRTTYRLRQQTLLLSLFAFVSPSDKDTHLRPSLTYKWSDAVTLVAGANIMAGDQAGFFGQLQDNSNGYIRIRYGF